MTSSRAARLARRNSWRRSRPELVKELSLSSSSPEARAGTTGGRPQSAAPVRRSVPRVPGPRRRSAGHRRSPTRARTRRSDSAPKRWRSSIARRRRSSATSVTNSARRSPCSSDRSKTVWPMSATPLPPVHRERQEVAHRNALRLLRLVNTLLDFSRIEAGRIDASYEPTDLAQFTAELASVFRSAVEKAGLALVVDCDPLPEPVYVDRDMWEKIVLNLLSNAFKFTFEGRITVELRSARRSRRAARRRHRRRHSRGRPAAHVRALPSRQAHVGPARTKARASDWRSCRNWPVSMAAASRSPARKAAARRSP